MVAHSSKRPLPVGTRGAVLIAIALAGIWAAWQLGLSFGDLLPSEGGWEVFKGFFARALSPALRTESEFVPEGAPSLLLVALQASWSTVAFAAAAISLSLIVGLLLGFAGSTAWWADDAFGGQSAFWTKVRRTAAPAFYATVRFVMTIMRSVHELLWAVLFLAAFGLTPVTAVLAIAIPYTGIFAKVFSEILDEAPRDAAHALRDAGASPLQVLGFGLVPRALPDMIAYAFYRFECALRSSAVLGFFGFPTLGYYLKLSFDSDHYGEVWTFLYTLFLLVILVDTLSGAIRRRLVV